MKKAFAICLLSLTFLNVRALTVDSTGVGTDFRVLYGMILDTVYGFTGHTITTYNTPIYPGTTTISVSHDLSNQTGAQCENSGSWVSCDTNDIRTNVEYSGNNWGTIDRGPSDSIVTPVLSEGSYPLLLQNKPKGETGTRCTHGTSCSMPWDDPTDGGTLVVQAAPPASVQLLISQYLDKTITHILSLLGLVNTAYAQTKAVNATSTQKPAAAIVVANVNLTNPQVTKVDTDSYYVSFALTNKGEAQPDVYYAFSLLDAKNTIVSTQTIPRAVTLEKDVPFFVTEKLTTPKGLSGTYTVRVQAYTQTGLPLGFGTAGKITLVGASTPSLSECILLKKSYDVNQVLNINCSVKNITGKNYVVSSKVFYGNEPHERKVVSSEIIDGEAATKIAGLVTPGVYTLRTSLYERGGAPVGKEIANQFIVKGTSVSILNLLLDKNKYVSGEKAKVAISLSIFSSVTPVKGLSVAAILSGKQGECAQPYTATLGGKRAVEFMMPVTSACKNPLLTVQVLNDKQVVLAEKSLQLTSKQTPLDLKTKVGYGAALALLLMATFSLLRRAKIHGLASIVRKVAKKK